MQQQPRLEGERARDLDQALMAEGERAGRQRLSASLQADEGESRGARALAIGLLRASSEAVSAAHHVVQHAHVVEELRGSGTCGRCRARRSHWAAASRWAGRQGDAAGVERLIAADQVEQRGLARAVRADERGDRAGRRRVKLTLLTARRLPNERAAPIDFQTQAGLLRGLRGAARSGSLTTRAAALRACPASTRRRQRRRSPRGRARKAISTTTVSAPMITPSQSGSERPRNSSRRPVTTAAPTHAAPDRHQAADDHGGDEVQAEGEAEDVRIHGAQVVHGEAAADARHAGREHEHLHLVAPDVDAGGTGRRLGRGDGLQRAADRASGRWRGPTSTNASTIAQTT